MIPEHGRMNELADSLSLWANVHRIPHIATYDRSSRVVGAVADRGQQARLATLFQRLAPDIIHVNQQVAEDGVDLLLAAKKSGFPWISTIHIGRSATELGAAGGILRDLTTRAGIWRAKGCHIAVSAESCRQLTARFGRTGARFVAVHNGTAVPDPALFAQARKEARASWSVKDDDLVIGAVGRIEAQKNPLGFIDALANMASAQTLRGVWIGDGALRSDMEAKARDPSRPIHLHVDGWREDAALRMAGFDIFLLPSLFEGLPFAVIEAMHAGLPIVASKSDGLSEAIDDGVSGFLCNDAAEVAARLQTLIDDAELRKAMSQSAKATASQRFTLRHMAQQTISIYETERRRHGVSW